MKLIRFPEQISPTVSGSAGSVGSTTPEVIIWIVATLLIVAIIATGLGSIGRGTNRLYAGVAEATTLLRAEQLLRREASHVEVPYWSREPIALTGGVVPFYDRRSDSFLSIRDSDEGTLIGVGEIEYPLADVELTLAVDSSDSWPVMVATVERRNRESLRIRAPLGGRPDALW